jgi:ribosomal protein S18 acetylase RimI-like enzyme
MEQDSKVNLTYRLARMSDVSLLAELNQQLIRDEGHENPMTLPELADRMKLWLRRECQAVLFARNDEVAAYALYRIDPGWIYLRQFFVSPAHRRQGIGRAAIRILLEAIFPAHTRVTVEVLYHNYRAHEFWRAVGFKDFAVTLEMLRP